MKALVLTGKKQLEIEDIKEPEVKPDEVLIHTAYAVFVVLIRHSMLVFLDLHQLFLLLF